MRRRSASLQPQPGDRTVVFHECGHHGFLPEGVPSNWTIVFGAEDVDKTLQEITENGGAVLRPAEDTPYGRLAAATDPTGTAFNLSSLQN
jgi:uncharacterized protein